MNPLHANPARGSSAQLAAGVILWRGTGRHVEVLLLQSARHGTWGFPKGHLEPGETERQGAFRELREETGVENVDLLDGFRHVMEYPLPQEEGDGEDAAVIKRVALFAARADGLDISLSGEHQRMEWTPVGRAPERLRFPEPCEALEALLRRLDAART